MDFNQDKLMEMVVDKVLKKHKVKIENNTLTDEEKEEIKNVVENIKKDVERFLQNQKKVKTEKDFQNNNQKMEDAPVVQITPQSNKSQKVFSQPNDVNTVKNFFAKRQK